MVLAAIPRVLQDVGAAAAALTATLLFVGLVWRSRPMRWVWRRLVAEPFASWFRAQIAHEIEPRIAEVRAELRPNGGSSFRDEMNRRLGDVERKVDHISDHNK